jgi:hypothetical protein
VFAGLLFGLLFAPPVLTFAGDVFWRASPVMQDWTPTMVSRDGKDLIVSGTVRKVWDCRYEPPPRARDEAGENLRVISAAPMAGVAWQSGVNKFGPWRVVNGAGRRIEFYQHHVCFRIFEVFTDLGRVDTTAGGTSP